MVRAWGFWSRGKLEVLSDYLDAFSTASKGASERIYLDLFAGQANNVDRHTGQVIKGSAEVALDVGDPPFTRLRFIELEHAEDLKSALASKSAGRDVKVCEGDCNEVIHDVLVELAPWRWAPAFAFLDPNGPDYRWSTLDALAAFKRDKRYKVELWILFPEPMFVRFLRADGGTVRPEDAERISQMYGTDIWSKIYQARLKGELEPREARDEYVNLMRWRLESDLEYRWTHTFEVRNQRGGPIYHLIFATDNEAGNRIMAHLYNRAASEFPKMRQEVIDQRRGFSMQTLFEELAETEQLYVHEPPVPPFGTPERADVDRRDS